MAANRLRNAFRTTKVRLTGLSADATMTIETLFMAYEAAQTDAVKAEREAGIAVNNAQIKRAKAQQAELELLNAAGEHNNQIAGERVWMAYKDKDGKIVFEGITNRLMRNNFRAQQELIGRQLSENSEDVGNDMYEDEDGEGGNSNPPEDAN